MRRLTIKQEGEQVNITTTDINPIKLESEIAEKYNFSKEHPVSVYFQKNNRILIIITNNPTTQARDEIKTILREHSNQLTQEELDLQKIRDYKKANSLTAQQMQEIIKILMKRDI